MRPGVTTGLYDAFILTSRHRYESSDEGDCKVMLDAAQTCSSMRLLGFSARYVSGYLLMQDKVQDASHAWAEVHVDSLGWVGFDISNGISPDDRYVKLATGFDYADVIPLSGVRFGSGEEQIATRIMISQQ